MKDKMGISQVEQLIFDADDTLWENNLYYIQAAEQMAELIAENGIHRDDFQNDFQKLERKVVQEKGYGSKNYLLILRSVYHSYQPLSNQQETEARFNQICQEFERQVNAPPRIFPGVPAILEHLSHKYSLYVLTKGNIEEQKEKLKKSGLLSYFRESFVVSEKNYDTYRYMLDTKGWPANRVCMIGNSPKSDINPSLRNGMYAVYIPYEFTWVLDDEPLTNDHPRLIKVSSFADLERIFIV
jgi:putative hydrolase of the HAD superfamily